MIVYQFDDDGRYLGLAEAQPSPLEPGKFLLPRNSVEESPPEPGEKQAAYYRNGAWVLDVDPDKLNKSERIEAGFEYRQPGTIVVGNDVRKATYEEMVSLGDITPVDALAGLKIELCDKIESLKTTIMRRGFDYPGGQIQGDDEAQANLMAWVLLDSLGSITYPMAWRRSSNTFLPINNSSDLMSLAQAMTQFKNSTYTSIFLAKDSIRVALSIAEAQVIYDTWLTGTGGQNV